jgi:hypothetical protein
MATNWLNRGISADAALRCCEAERLALELDIRGFIGELLNRVLEIRTGNVFDVQLALVPPPLRRELPKVRRVWRIGRFVKGTPLVVGAIVLMSTFAMESLIGQLAALETLQGVMDGLDQIIQSSGCKTCISKKIWRQNRPQVKSQVLARIRQ